MSIPSHVINGCRQKSQAQSYDTDDEADMEVLHHC